jgi:hypothetical protein
MPTLVAHDEVIETLDAATRRVVAETSARRAALELEGAAAFTAVTQALIELSADARIVDLSARAIAEEIRHSELYLELARAYGDARIPAPRPAPIDVPTYAGTTADEQRMLRVIGMCSINETMACAFLELSLSGATAKAARAAIREILEDEIRHARIGWAYLGSRDVGAAERRLLGAWLLPMLRAQWAKWKAQIATLPDVDASAHGCPAPAAIERASLAAMASLVVAGFEHAGVAASDTRRWLDAGALT